jgi:hypothetical protein
MSTRVLASIGVVLCMVMTSFSIYLGVIEHIYTPHARTSIVVQTAFGTDRICLPAQSHRNTTTTGPTSRNTPAPCRATAGS